MADETVANGRDTGELLRGYIRVLWHRRWLIGLVVVATVASAWIFTKLQTPEYQAAATVLIDPEPPRVVNVQDVTPTEGGQEYYATQYKLIQSRTVVDAVIERLRLKERIPGLARAADPYGALVWRTGADPVKNTRLVMVSFQHENPQLAAEVANGLANEYVAYNLGLKHKAAEDAVVWLRDQLTNVRARAEHSSAALQAYQTKADLLGLQEQRQITAQKIMDLNRAYQEAQTQRLTIESKLRELKRILRDPTGEGTVLAVVDDPFIRKLREEASNLQSERARLGQMYKHKHPDVQQVEAQLKYVNDRLQAEVQKLVGVVETDYQVAKTREDRVQAQVGELRREAQQLVARESRSLGLQQEKDSSSEMLATVVKRLQETGVQTALQANNIRVVEPATVPQLPAKPRKRLILTLSVVLGVALGVGGAFVADSLDNRIRSAMDVERSGVPVLGIVPAFELKHRG